LENRSLTDDPYDLATRRVEHALRRFQDAWRDRSATRMNEDLDELDVAVGLWLDVHETAGAEERSLS